VLNDADKASALESYWRLKLARDFGIGIFGTAVSLKAPLQKSCAKTRDLILEFGNSRKPVM
jgi:hypothetical protein